MAELSEELAQVLTIIRKTIADAHADEVAHPRPSKINDIAFGKVAAAQRIDEEVRAAFGLPAAQPAPDRTVPQELVDLAVLAIKRGALSVSLGHESLGYEFQAPIGWILWINEAGDDGFPKEGSTVMINHQAGCDFDDFVLPAWLAGDDVPEQPAIDQLIDLFEAGIKNGWNVAYERKMFDHQSFQEVARKLGYTDETGMRHRLTGNASNWHYDQAARDRGDQVSTEATLSICEGETPEPLAWSNDGGEPRQVQPTDVEALLTAQAPNFVPVAYFDDETEEWVK